MSDLIVNGGRALSGVITPSGNKNSVLPILCATLLTDEPVTLKNVPEISDLEKLVAFLRSQGSRIDWNRQSRTLTTDHSAFNSTLACYQLPQDMRSTVLLYPALLYRIKKLFIEGNTRGCTLGVREIDPHLDILSALGAQISRHPDGSLDMALPSGYRGGRYWLDYMSVTVTENFVMAAAIAEGESTLINAASEPHVQELMLALNAMGARISGIGTSKVEITGVEKLHGATITIGSDYHEIVTFLALGAITNGEVYVKKALPQHFDLINRTFKKLGVKIEHDGDTAFVRKDQPLVIDAPFTSNLLPKIEAAPWPYFSVDLLPLVIALSTRAKGTVLFWNKVYENGFSWIPELAKFGAHALVSDPHRITVFGNRPLHPAVVDSPYIIRAAVALTMVAASIPGRSVIRNAQIIKRAHPFFVENLCALGADLQWQD